VYFDVPAAQQNGMEEGPLFLTSAPSYLPPLYFSTSLHTVTISWALFSLCKRKDLLLAVRKEYRQFFSQFDSNETATTTAAGDGDEAQRTRLLDAYANLKLSAAIVKESIRLYPPAVISSATSVSDEPVTLSNGITIQKGDVSFMYFGGTLKSPAVFDDPDMFNPHRWLTGDREQLARMEHAFVGFGSGPRICPGLNLANMEVCLCCVLCDMVWWMMCDVM
jgi:cytochrome P450